MKIAKEILTEQNGSAPAVKTIHAGLETSFFAKKNPALDIISIGTTNEHAQPKSSLRELKT